MLKTPLYTRIQQVQPKLHGLAVGMTLGIGTIVLNQGCPLVGSCPACAACIPRLPLLALPFLADGIVMLSAKVMKVRAGDD
jgi:hypothetical protein